MKRFVFEQFKTWKENVNRKPLIVRGSRQVGKTWLLKEFGKTAYQKCVYVNFEDEPQLKDLFKSDFNIERIINVLQVFSGQTITAEDTLIIFDEIQEVERGLTSLKYFCEKAPEYHIATAGSLLGIALHEGTSFPVGKVNFIDVYPLSFGEFLLAHSEDGLLKMLKDKDWSAIQLFRQRLIDYLKNYMYVGGMPEAVTAFCEQKDYSKVRIIQNEILNTYENDFSKHAPYSIVPRIRMVWQSIQAQLARENKKFIYGAVKHGSRAKDFEISLQWLLDCGLITKCFRITKPALPLSAYADFDAFKIYLLDVGLLGAMSGLNAKTLINGDELFVEFKGALTEQFVLQQLRAFPNTFISYWTNDHNTAEVDFVIQIDETVLPIEVKAGENLQAKSFRFFCEKYRPTTAIRTSLSNYRKETLFENIPLFGFIPENIFS